MPRVKGGPKGTRKHKKVLKATKGYWGARSKHFRSAHEAYLHAGEYAFAGRRLRYLHAGEYAFAGRRLRRRNFRRLWIQRINAALTPFEISYSKFIQRINAAPTPFEISYSKFIKALKDKKIELDRKVLADLAVTDPETFGAVVKKASTK